MKVLKYTVVATIVLALAALAAYLYRDSIARNVANRALRDQSISVAGLSVDSIGRDTVRFSELVLEQPDGSLIRIHGITLPLNIASPRPAEMSIESVALEQADDDRPPPALAILLQAFLDAPTIVANTTVHVEHMLIPRIPPINNVHWKSGDTGQNLQLDIESFGFLIEIDDRTDAGYAARVSVADADGSAASELNFQIERLDDGIGVEGTTRVDLSSWLPVYHRLGVVPSELVALDAVVGGPFTINLFDDPAADTLVAAELTPAGDISVEYASGSGSSVYARAVSLSTIQTRFAYPSFDWSAAITSAELRVTNDTVSELPVEVADVQCVPGIVCTMNASTSSGPVSVSGWTIETIDATAPLTAETGGGTTIDISSDTRFSLSGLQNSDTRISRVASTRLTGATMRVDERGWHLRAESLALDVNELTTDSGIAATFPVQLTSLQVSDSGADTSAQYEIASGAMALELENVEIATPAATGNFRVLGDAIETQQSLEAANGGITANISMAHNTSTEEGSMQISNALLDFDAQSLSNLLPDWPHEWDLVGGRWGITGNIQWELAGDESQYAGEIKNALEDIEGTNNDSAFAGLASQFTFDIDSSRGHSIGTSALSVDLLDVGVPVEDVLVSFSVPTDEPVLDVDALSLSLLGGRLLADPFRFDPESTNDVVLNIRSVQLEFIVGILEFEKLSMQGSVSGRLPMTVSMEQVTIDAGRLESDAPGGTIQYGAAEANLSAVDAQLGLVSRALANFQFETLNSDVSYNEAGDLLLSMRLEGVNPDMDATQPVILNLNVENNIPQMLKSLRATRSIEEILERKVAK